MRVIVVLLLTGLATFFAGADASAADPKRVALVIGNARYPNEDKPLNADIPTALANIPNDTRDMADELRRDGFDVDRQFDLTGDGMRQALERFYAKIEPNSVAMLFFDGIGVQVQSRTYLLGIDAPIWYESTIARDGFDLENIVQEMNRRRALVKIVILDAARSNKFERNMHRSSAGPGAISMPSNTLLLYSTLPGHVISDVHTEHGLFVTELLREIRAPGVSAEQAFKNTKDGVAAATNKEQVPLPMSSMTVDFGFLGGPSVGPTPSPTPTSPPRLPACEAAVAPRPPSADELAGDPRIRDQSRRIEQDPNDRTAYYKRGQLYAVKRAYSQAATDFDRAIALGRQDAEAYNNRCWTRAAIDDLLNALRDCDQALRLNPSLYDALDSRGLVNLKIGRYAEAIRDYNASLEKNPNSVSSLFGRGMALKRSGGDGAADLRQAKEMDRNVASEFAGYGVSECGP